MATSRIDVFMAIQTLLNGAVDQWGSIREPLVSITGTGSPSQSNGQPTVAVVAEEFKELYNFDRDGGFDFAALVPDVDCECWWQVGTPADGSSSKGTLLWNHATVPAGRPFVLPSPLSRTNTVAASHNSDNSDEPLALTDVGETAARIWLIGVLPAETGTVQFIRRS